MPLSSLAAATSTTIDRDEAAVLDSPVRRVHGSLKFSGEGAQLDPRRSFNIRPAIDELPEEHPLMIEINGRPVASFICTRTALKELAVGWSFVHGYFQHPEQIQHVTIHHDRISVMIDRPTSRVASNDDEDDDHEQAHLSPDPELSAPAAFDDQAAPTSDLTFDRIQFVAIVERIFSRILATPNSETLHHAAITDGDQLNAISHDLSRARAVEKIIGWTRLKRLDGSRLILCLSGRVTADLTSHAARAGIPIIASRALPTADAVEIAHDHAITLVGRVLDRERAVYAHSWRLTAGEPEL